MERKGMVGFLFLMPKEEEARPVIPTVSEVVVQ
jgi:hypothetical protein